jgi:hypothetical protein
MTQRSQWPGSQALFYLLVLKHHGATQGERDNIKEAKPDTDSLTMERRAYAAN